MNHTTLLVISDTHTIDRAQTPFPDTTRRCELGNELVERAIRDAELTGGFDAIALMGDLIEDGTAVGAEQDLASLEARVSDLVDHIPLMVVPGNHDPDQQFCLRLFNDHQGLHRLNGYRFYTFVDTWDENNVGHRPTSQLEEFQNLASQDRDAPLIVLQHNPLYPPIYDEYPFVLADHEHIMNVYEKANVRLSLSAHYHPGQEMASRNNVFYWTSPTLSKPPFQYTLIHFRGQDVEIEPRKLQLPENIPLMDVHAHTHYAYCADNVSAKKVIQRADTFHVGTQCLTEHADQLYMTREQHASGLPFRSGGYWDSNGEGNADRMNRYQQEVKRLRQDSVRLGVEIELDRNGAPAIHPGHLGDWDIKLGSVHWLPHDIDSLSPDEIQHSFLQNTRALLEAGIDVLAHPFRFFRGVELPPPTAIYGQVADLLVEHGAAAELNFHYNDPDPAFFSICLERNIPIATGTDAHKLCEVGALRPHIYFIQNLTEPRALQNVLFTELGDDHAEIK